MGNGGKRKGSDRSELTALCRRVAARQGKGEACGRPLKECEEPPGIVNAGIPVSGIEDVTARRQAEERPRVSEKTYRSLVENSNDGICILQDGVVKFANAHLSCLLGYATEEGIGSSFHRYVSPKELPKVRERYASLVKGEKDDDRFETVLVSRDGQRIETELNISVTDYEGRRSVLVFIRDITERHRAEETLRQSERKYRELVENINDVIYRVDESGTIAYVSPAVETMLGYTPAEVVNHSFARFIYREDLPRCMKNFQLTLEDNVTSGEYRVVTRSGSIRWIRTSTRPVMQGDRVIAVEGVLTDITERREAEELLRESEERYRTFLQNFQGIAFRQHFDFTPVFFHGNCEGITGYREEDLAGGKIRWNDIVYPEDLAMFYETGIRLHGTPDQAIERQYRIIRKDGRVVWVHEFIRNICNHKGRPVMLQGSVYDITDHKLADQALQQSQNELSIRNRIANIFLTLSDEAIYSEVLKVVLDAVESPLGYFGYIDEGGNLVCPMLSRHIREHCRMPGKDIRFHSESWRGLWGKSLAEKGSFIMNTPLTVPEGHLPINRTLIVPVIHKGEVIGQITVANRDQDYSDADLGLLEAIAHSIAPLLHARLQVERQEERRSRAETELFLTKSHLEYLLRSVPAVIYSRKVNEGWPPTFVSENILVQIGYTREDFLADPEFWINHVHPEDAGGVLAGLERIIEEGVLIHEYRFLHHDGAYHWLRDDCRLVRDAAGAPLEIVGSLIDITEHRRLEEQFYHAQKMEAIGILAGGIAHDFNNLLQAIMGYSDSILLDGDDPQQHIRDIEQIKKATAKAASLTRQLLAFSRKQSLDPGLLDINALIKDMGVMLGRIIGEDIELTETLQPDLRGVKGDQGQMEQVVMNLVVNAREAMPKGGMLILGTENVTVRKEDCKGIPHAEPGEYVSLSVEDTGTGIDRRIMDRIFEPFFSTKHQVEGTGLGLSTVYGIVKQHGGWITVESTPGKGSVFRIYLPCSDLGAGDSWPEKASVVDLKGNGERILIVEDEASVRELAKRALSNAGYVVFDASCVQDALGIFEGEGGRFDLVLSDVVLPDQSGLFLTRRLKTDAASVKIILSSGYTDEKSQSKIIQGEGVDFLQKPYTLRELLTCVKRSIQSSS
ncbi:MAG: PAS domain S-box protein [bacterium]